MIQQTFKGVFYVVGFESRFFLGLNTMKKEPMPVIYNSSDKNMIKQDVGASFIIFPKKLNTFSYTKQSKEIGNFEKYCVQSAAATGNQLF